MDGYVVWLTGDRGRMEAIAGPLRQALAGTARSVDAIAAETVEEKLCSVEPRGPDFGDLVLRRLGWLCRLLARNGCAVVALAASPGRAVRDDVRRMTGGRMIEVLVHGDLPAGYEPPHYPEAEWKTGEAAADAIRRIRAALADAGLLGAAANVYSAEEEARIKDRLEKLGYL